MVLGQLGTEDGVDLELQLLSAMAGQELGLG